MSSQLLHLAFHPLIRQLLCLLLWCGTSLSLLLINRTLLHYSIFRMPWFLALGSAGLALVAGWVLLYLVCGFSDPLFQAGTGRVWRHVLLTGALMGASAGLHNTAVQLLPIPAVAVAQAATPALAYSFGALLLQQQQQQRLQCAPVLKALLALCGVWVALWPDHQHLNLKGVLCQAAATALEALWCQLHLAELQPHQRAVTQEVPGSSPGGSERDKSVLQQASPLVLLAGSAPAAVLVLALPTTLCDGSSMDHDKFRYRAMMPAAAVSCVLACCTALLQFDPGVLRSLATEPWGVLARAARDVLVVLAAASGFNEGLSEGQWAGYAIAQMANVYLCWDSSSSSGGGRLAAGDSRIDGSSSSSSKLKQG